MKNVIFILLLIFLSSNLHSQTWTLQTSVAGHLNSAWAVNSNVVWMCGPNDVVIRTTNGGTNWAPANAGLSGNAFYSITAINDQIAIVGAGDGSLWRTTNGGASWILFILTPPPVFIDALHMFDANNGFCLSDPPGSASFWLYYITTNGGVNWTVGANRPPNAANEAGWNNSYMALDTGHIWWGTNASKIWRGSFRGPFISTPTTNPSSFGISFNDALTGSAIMVTAGNNAGPISITSNGGINWATNSFTPPGMPFAIRGIPYSGYVWIGHATGIMMSTNNGVTFTPQFTLANACNALTFVNINLGWCGTEGGNIYKYTNNISGTGHISESIPLNYSIEQNYPNPFNPTTDIRYNLPKASNVTLKLYDVLGNEVMTVVYGFQSAGNYSETIDASNLSSGVYFYTIKAGDFTASKKMSLIK